MQFLELLMQPIRRCWLLALAALLIFSASVAADNPTPVTAEKDDATPDRIARLIEQLGS
jgi:hypothetical protein